MIVNNRQKGFTVVELLVTIFVGAMFMAMFYQLFVANAQVSGGARQAAEASNLAYSNIKKYPSSDSTGLTCSAASTNLVNTTSTNSDYPDLGSITETVAASFPYDCAANPDIVLLVSSVTYGKDNTKVSHAAYVN